ncbi:MAG TPA: hypothetical protein VHW24_28505 [Bryobacteraceae bacterium]|jgi:hypothetical protein|nr:hypothetical protein [Bryobacteraceae bacterium]
MSQENIAAGLPQPSTASETQSSIESKPRSGGPRTPEGKRRSSLNATKFGIFSKISIAPAEELATYTAHCAAYAEALQPVGIVESDIVQQIADLRYRLKRCNSAEQSIFARGFEDHIDEISTGLPEVDTALAEGATFLQHIQFLELLSLYESRLQRAVERNTAQLEKLQSERKSAAAKAEAEASQVRKPVSSAAAAQAYGADFDRSPAANEFVFSESATAHATAGQTHPARSSKPQKRENSAA